MRTFPFLLCVLLVAINAGAAPSGGSSHSTSTVDEIKEHRIRPTGHELIPRFDGQILTETMVNDFVEGTLVTWGQCDTDARRAGLCEFYFVEEDGHGGRNTLMMSDENCESQSSYCRNGYIASARSTHSQSYDASSGEIILDTHLWQTQVGPRIRNFRESYLGSVHGRLTRNSYHLTSYDPDGVMVDEQRATVLANTRDPIDLCEMIWESSLIAAPIAGIGIGAASATAISDLLLGLAVTAEAAGFAGTAQGALSLGVGITQAPWVMMAVGAVAVVGASAVAINHWCIDDTSDDPPSDGPSDVDPPNDETPGGDECNDDEYYGPVEVSCGYTEEMKTIDNGDGTGEVIVTRTEHTCIVWTCLPL